MSTLFKIVKLNGKYTGHECFTHMVEFKSTRIYTRNRLQNVSSSDLRYEFYSLMKWCWDAFGPGAERDSVLCAFYEKKAYELRVQMSIDRIEKVLEIADVKWSWFIYDNKHRIYLKDEAATLVKLKLQIY